MKYLLENFSRYFCSWQLYLYWGRKIMNVIWFMRKKLILRCSLPCPVIWGKNLCTLKVTNIILSYCHTVILSYWIWWAHWGHMCVATSLIVCLYSSEVVLVVSLIEALQFLGLSTSAALPFLPLSFVISETKTNLKRHGNVETMINSRWCKNWTHHDCLIFGSTFLAFIVILPNRNHVRLW